MKICDQDLISVDELRDLFRYEPETGLLFWKNRPDAPYLEGKLVGGLCHGYVTVKIRRRIFRAHRIIWTMLHGRWPESEIDHADGDKANNRLENLREASRSQNVTNADSGRNRLGFRGVHARRCAGGVTKYRAAVVQNGRRINLGTFDRLDEARAAYETASKKHHGAFSYTHRQYGG